MFNAVSNNDMMEWLVSGEQVPAIETLELSIIGKDESRGIGHGLRVFGPCLKRLEVRFTFNGSIQSALRFHRSQETFLLTLVPRCVFARCGSKVQYQS